MSTYEAFYKQLLSLVQEDFPQTFKLLESGKLNVDWKHLVSPQQVSISEKSHDKMIKTVKALFDYTRRASKALTAVDNYSVLMSYDFHTGMDGNAKLIEVNTNASGFLIASLGIACAEKKSIHELSHMSLLKESFLSEAYPMKELKIAIVDDEISNQKMQIEFHLYNELFQSWGWLSEICEAKDLVIREDQIFSPNGRPLNFIYNRTTDFFLKEKRHEALLKAWKEKLAVVSPQPQEYERLADKNRLLEMQRNRSQLPKEIQEVLLASYEVSDFESSEKLWSQRKNLFFKPKNSFGGKSAYRGQSVSHKVFDRLIAEDPMIQEYFPPQKHEEWKFDLRCFAYKDQVHFTAARLYQGQVTNFSAPFGGFCPVHLKS